MSLMQDGEDHYLGRVKSMTAFHEAEEEWDAGVCQSPLSQQRRSRVVFRKGLPLAAASSCAAFMPMVVSPWQGSSRCWMLPAFLGRVP